MFCRRTLRVMQANPHIVPPSLAEDLASAAADLTVLDQLRPLLDRLQKLTARISDSIDLLGSDAMHAALDGYAQLKLSGGDAGLIAPATAVPQKPPPGGFCMSGGVFSGRFGPK